MTCETSLFNKSINYEVSNGKIKGSEYIIICIIATTRHNNLSQVFGTMGKGTKDKSIDRNSGRFFEFNFCSCFT